MKTNKIQSIKYFEACIKNLKNYSLKKHRTNTNAECFRLVDQFQNPVSNVSSHVVAKLIEDEKIIFVDNVYKPKTK